MLEHFGLEYHAIVCDKHQRVLSSLLHENSSIADSVLLMISNRDDEGTQEPSPKVYMLQEFLKNQSEILKNQTVVNFNLEDDYGLLASSNSIIINPFGDDYDEKIPALLGKLFLNGYRVDWRKYLEFEIVVFIILTCQDIP